MSGHSDERRLGKRDGLRWAITWLHGHAKSMNDPKATAILNSAAFSLGNEIREGRLPAISDGETPAQEIARLQREIGERQMRLQFLVLGDQRKSVTIQARLP